MEEEKKMEVNAEVQKISKWKTKGVILSILGLCLAFWCCYGTYDDPSIGIAYAPFGLVSMVFLLIGACRALYFEWYKFKVDKKMFNWFIVILAVIDLLVLYDPDIVFKPVLDVLLVNHSSWRHHPNWKYYPYWK